MIQTKMKCNQVGNENDKQLQNHLTINRYHHIV